MATAIEYGLLAALIGVASVGGVQATGGKVQDTFCSVAGAMGGYSCGESPAEFQAAHMGMNLEQYTWVMKNNPGAYQSLVGRDDLDDWQWYEGTIRPEDGGGYFVDFMRPQDVQPLIDSGLYTNVKFMPRPPK